MGHVAPSHHQVHHPASPSLPIGTLLIYKVIWFTCTFLFHGVKSHIMYLKYIQWELVTSHSNMVVSCSFNVIDINCKCLPDKNMLVSSANKTDRLVVVMVVKPLIYSKMSNGPRIDACATLHFTFSLSDLTLLCVAYCKRLDPLSNHFTAIPCTPHFSSFWGRMPLSTVSKAFEKSRNIHITSSPWSRVSVILSTNVISTIWMDFPSWNRNWYSYIKPWRMMRRRLYISISKIFWQYL